MKKFLFLFIMMLASVSMATVHTVNVLALSFAPASLTVQAGDTVRWVKPAGGFHNVAEATNPPLFRSGDPTSSAFTYQFIFTAQHAGAHNYVCEVHAASGMVGTVTVQGGGEAPTVPSNPTPINGATNFPQLGFLIWESEGADHFIVQFGTVNPPPVVNANFMGMMFSYSGLPANTQHFWKITAVNDFGDTAGPVWSFTTIAPPAQATGPFPDNNAINVPLNIVLIWEPADRAEFYQVYLGTSEPLGFIGETTSTQMDPQVNLTHSTTYQWRVDPVNDAGTTVGTTWSFTTEAGSGAGDPVLPVAFELGAAYPNPFNSNVRIGLNVAQESQTVVRIFDIVGQEVSKLVDSRLSAGQHTVEWNAAGQSAGLYFLRCECAGLTQTQKLIYLP